MKRFVLNIALNLRKNITDILTIVSISVMCKI